MQYQSGDMLLAWLELCTLLQYMGFASFVANDIIFQQGDTGQHFYIILSGAVEVSVYDDEEVGEKVGAVLLLDMLLLVHGAMWKRLSYT